ncbi:hypothetical protein TNCV_4748651 [Trichonephila clavipes]|nr:hypothetical protein TNCV_4748651 [Trichonephila clavipes]
MADKDILEFVQSSKNIIDADSSDENEMKNAASDHTSYEMRNIMKSMRSYLDEHSNGEMNNKMDDIEQFDAKKDNEKKNIKLLSKYSSINETGESPEKERIETGAEREERDQPRSYSESEGDFSDERDHERRWRWRTGKSVLERWAKD